jgi:hypothetical protein
MSDMNFFALPAVEANEPYDVGRSTRELLDHYVEYAKDTVLRDGYTAPVIVIRSEKKVNAIHCGPMMKDDATKDQLATTLRQASLAMEAIAYVFIAESWIARVDKSLGESYEAQRPSRRPDRIECVLISGQYKGDRPGMRLLEMIRDAAGRVTRLVENDAYKDKDMTFEGRFVGLLDPAPDREPEDDRWRRIMDGI